VLSTDLAMRINLSILLSITAAALLTGCAAIRPAQMKLPDGLAESTEAAGITGLGGGTRGSYQLAGHAGSFSRSASRLALFDDLAVFNRGGAGYSIAGPDFVQPVQARCTLRQTTMQIRVLAFTPKKLAYECDFDGAAARLSLQEAAGSALGRAERRGELVLDGITVTMRSVHELVGTPLGVQAPIGYVIELAGQPIAAVELNGTEPRLRLPRGERDQRRAALLAALALALLWDPAGD
jgi:hypothetical protein